MRKKKDRKTYDFDNEKYSPELIRQYEDPAYAKAAQEYENEARRRKAYKHIAEEEPQYNNFEEMLEAEYGTMALPEKQSRGRKKYRVRKSIVVRNILGCILLFVILAAGLFFFMTKDIESEKVEDYMFSIDDQVADDMRDYRNILILGSDARADEPIENSRTDAVIIMSINRKNNDVRLISVMRDSYLDMEEDGARTFDKLTHAHAYGGGVNTAASLNRNLDLNIEEYVVFNWQAVADAVDCLGGIEIDVKEDEIGDMNHYGYETAENTGGTYKEIIGPGRQTLDGVQAATYCRIRKNCGGDSGRTGRYKKVVAGVMKKGLAHPFKLGALTEAITPNIRTNMKQTNLFTAAMRAPFFDIQEGMTWPENYWGGIVGEVYYVIPTTLKGNVEILHNNAFDQNAYMVSPTCMENSRKIIEETGIE